MIGVPQFSDDENLLAFYNTVADFIQNGLAHFFFILIQMGRVEVTVTDVDCVLGGQSRVTFKWLQTKNKW